MCVFRLLCCLSALCALLRVFISVSFHSDECVLCMCLLFCASLCSRYYSTGPFFVNANCRLMYANMICRRVSTFRSLTHIGTEKAEKKCLQNCVCVSPEPSRRYVCEWILGILAQTTHTHIGTVIQQLAATAVLCISVRFWHFSRCCCCLFSLVVRFRTLCQIKTNVHHVAQRCAKI